MPSDAKTLFQIADRYCDSALLQQAHALGVFELLRQPRSSDDVAEAKGWIKTKTRIFLDALTALELLQKIGGRYTNAPCVEASLVKGADGYIGDLIEHERLQWRLWERLDHILASDHALSGQQDLNLPQNEHANAVFHRAMMQLANELVGLVASLPEWNQAHRVLDLAGGHGLYLCEVAKRHLSVTGEIWDVSSARSQAESVIEANGVAERVRFVEHDISDRKSYEGVTADAVMLNHCLHHFDANGVANIAKSIASVVPTGGIVTILDVHLERGRTVPAENAMFSLYMMVNTERGQIHPTDEIAAVFEQCGFSLETRLLDSLEGDFLMVGHKR